MSLKESSTVTKSTVNPDVGVSSEILHSQNSYKEGMAMGTRDTNLASDTEAENRVHIHTTHLDFLPLIQPERNPQENECLRLIVRVSLKEEMMNMKALKGFVQSQNMTSLSLISQKA